MTKQEETHRKPSEKTSKIPSVIITPDGDVDFDVKAWLEYSRVGTILVRKSENAEDNGRDL